MGKYKIIPSSRTIVHSPISIGHKAEKGVEAIEFDLTAWVETYGSGTLTVIMRRWGDAIPYPIALEIGEDNKATWTLSDIDTAKAGMAYAQLNYIVGDEVVKKSDIYTFRVMDSLTGEGEPPEAYESWLEHLTHLAAEAMAEVLDIEGVVTDKTLTVDGGIADGKATGDALALKADKSTTYTKAEVDQMIEDVEVETDTTLEVAGAPADAKKTGDELSALKADLDAVGTVSEIGRDEFTEIAWLISKQNKWDNSAAAQTSVKGLLDISGCEKLTITPNGGVYAFLNTYSPVKDATPDYSESYNSRIVPSGSTPIDYVVEPDMNYLYVVMENSSGEDVFPLIESHRSIKTDNTLTEEYIPAEARAVGDALSLKLGVSDFENLRDALLSSGVHTYVEFKDGYIDTSGTQVDVTSVVQNANFKHIVIPCTEGDAFHFNVLGGNSARLRWVFCDTNGNVLYKSQSAAESSSATPILYNNTGVYIAPSGTAYLISNHHIMDAGFTPKVYKCYPNSMLNHIASLSGEFPYMPLENWRRQVIATYESYIAIKDGNSIRISSDCGDTWTENIDASNVGDIKNAHFFANGTLAIFTDLDAYYVENMIVNQASVYEADGITPFEADEDRNFNALRDHAERKFINGNDMYVFNNYHKVAGTGRPIVWYSIDNGHTYRIAVEFNIENMPSVRHFHDVIYWAQYDKFILATGDTNATECYVCALSYDPNNDSWDMQILAGSSRDYKWCGLSIWNNEIYYCYDSTPGAVWKCSYADIADKSKHTCVLDYTESDCLHNAFGKNGDMVVTMSTSRSTGGQTVEIPFTAEECVRKIRYSTNRKDFQEIFLPNQLLNYVSSIGRPKPVTSDGHVYFSSTSGVDGLPSIPIDDYVRIFLNKNAFGARI